MWQGRSNVDGICVTITVDVTGKPGCAAAGGAGVVHDHACQINRVDIPITVGISPFFVRYIRLAGNQISFQFQSVCELLNTCAVHFRVYQWRAMKS